MAFREVELRGGVVIGDRIYRVSVSSWQESVTLQRGNLRRRLGNPKLQRASNGQNPERSSVPQRWAESSVRFKMDFEGNGAVAANKQAKDEGSGGVADAGCSPGGPEDLGFASVLEGQGGPGSPCGPNGAGDLDNESGPDSPNGQGGPGVLGGPGVEETAGSAAVDAPSVAQAAHASGPGGDAAAAAVGPGNPQTVLYPFQRAPESWWPRDGSGTSQNARVVWGQGTR